MNKKVIGISASIYNETEKEFLGSQYAYLPQDYINAIHSFNSIAIILPVTEDRDIIKEYVSKIDALILSGGYDVSPNLYKQNPKEKLGETMPLRDYFEINLIVEAVNQRKPIFGICRGMQLINIAFGGSLFQDLSYRKEENIQHVQKSNAINTSHFVYLSGELSTFFNKEKILVNSFHHQGIDKLANGFKVLAHSDDNLIEAIFSNEKDTWILGVQWHPEMSFTSDENSKKIFKYFIDNIF